MCLVRLWRAAVLFTHAGIGACGDPAASSGHLRPKQGIRAGRETSASISVMSQSEASGTCHPHDSSSPPSSSSVVPIPPLSPQLLAVPVETSVHLYERNTWSHASSLSDDFITQVGGWVAERSGFFCFSLLFFSCFCFVSFVPHLFFLPPFHPPAL